MCIKFTNMRRNMKHIIQDAKNSIYAVLGIYIADLTLHKVQTLFMYFIWISTAFLFLSLIRLFSRI